MDLVLQFLKDINIAQLLAIAVMIWFFYSRLDSKIEKLRQESKSDMDYFRQEIKTEIGKLENEMSKLKDKVEDVDRRLCRIEGSLATHGHWLFNQPSQEKKAQ